MVIKFLELINQLNVTRDSLDSLVKAGYETPETTHDELVKLQVLLNECLPIESRPALAPILSKPIQTKVDHKFKKGQWLINSQNTLCMIHELVPEGYLALEARGFIFTIPLALEGSVEPFRQYVESGIVWTFHESDNELDNFGYVENEIGDRYTGLEEVQDLITGGIVNV